MLLEKTASGFTLSLDGRPIIAHTAQDPAFFAGRGEERMDTRRASSSSCCLRRAPPMCRR